MFRLKKTLLFSYLFFCALYIKKANLLIYATGKLYHYLAFLYKQNLSTLSHYRALHRNRTSLPLHLLAILCPHYLYEVQFLSYMVCLHSTHTTRTIKRVRWGFVIFYSSYINLNLILSVLILLSLYQHSIKTVAFSIYTKIYWMAYSYHL